MKNTVKKILALVFAVAMICTMAVPAFAAEETIDVVVTVKNYDGDSDSIAVTVEADEATVEEAIKAFNKKNNDNDIEVSVLGTTGLVNKVGGKKAGDIENLFGTGYWAVAVNGKLVAEDLDTVAIEEGDRVVVYWNDPTFDTKLVQVDDSLLEKGVVAFYYYNAEGEKVALEGAEIVLKNGTEGILEDALNADAPYFTADDKGQIWLQPLYLNNAGSTAIEIVSVEIEPLKAADKYDYSEAKMKYYNANLTRNIEDVDAVNYPISVADLYADAEATGDMTMVYVLVAAAAVVTLAAVVVMKKKAVKAN